MCPIGWSGSLKGIGHSAGNAATGATGDSTRSKGSVAATVVCRIVWMLW